MAYSDTLITIRDNLASELETETTYRAANGPKPTYSANGRTVSWNEYLREMLASLRSLDAQIAGQDEPFEEVTRGYT